MPKLNWNTVIFTIGFALLAWMGKELYTEVRSTHDAVLTMKGQMSNYDVQISDVRARLTQVEADIIKLKDRKP